MIRLRTWLALLLLALAAGPLPAQLRLPDRVAPVVDDANVVSPETEQLLTRALQGFVQTQQRQVSVVTVPDLQGYAVADYGHLLGRSRGLDNGAILIVAPGDMQVWIEVGAGLTPVLPESAAREIVETWVLPSVAQGDFDKGVLDGTGAIFDRLELPPEQAAALAEQARLEQARARADAGSPWIGLAVLILLLVLWPILRRLIRSLFGVAGAIVLLGVGAAGGRGGGYGGFGGGGAGFNGGGASGRW